MKKAMVAVLVLVLAGSTMAVAAGRGGESRTRRGLRKLGFRVYWSILTEEQKVEAKQIIIDHLAATAPDRMAAAARFLRYRAEVAAVLTKEQRIEAWKLRRAVRRLPAAKRKELLDKLLDGTDRAALADRVERIVGARPEDQVEIGFEIAGQVHELLLEKLGERLHLTPDQESRIRAAFESLKTDLGSVALRLAKARAEAVRKGIALLDEEQKAKLERVKAAVLPKVLEFLRG